MSNDKIDRQIIIAWNSCSDVIREVENTFGSDIILKKEFNFTPAERAEKINQIYHPIHVPHNSSRCNYKEPLTVFIIQMEPKYKYYLRTEGYLLCNSIILDFKIQNRKKFNFELFHCSDSVEETKKALQALNLSEFIPNCDIVDMENIRHIRHISDNTIEIHKLRDCVSVQHLIGYSIEDLNNKYNLLTVENNKHVVKSDTIEHFTSLQDFNQEHSDCKIEAYKYLDNYYIVTDGKHRSALLYFRGDRHIFIRKSQAPCSKDHLLKSIRETADISHLENLHKVIYSLHNSNIKYVVIRGYKTMPKTADTDLDIVIHPEDYEKFLILMESHLKNGTLLFNIEKSYQSSQKALYRAYRTSGVYNDFLTNKGYQLDTYNTVFFCTSQNSAIILSQYFINQLFSNRKKHHHLYIPDDLSNMVLLFCRTYIDLNGNWKTKHKTHFNEMKVASNINKDQFVNCLREALTPDYHYLISQVDLLFV